MKEVIYQKTEEGPKDYGDEKCSCGGKVFRTQIGCPENKPGCLVIHHGYRCEDCGRIYQ